MLNLVEKTRQSLIAQHGESKVEVVNGTTYRKINVFLDCFDLFFKRFSSVLKKLGMDASAYKQEFATIFEYFEQADENSIKQISSSLHSFIRQINDENLEEYRLKMTNFFNNIKNLAQNPNFNIEQVKVCFATDLNLNVKTGCSMHKNRASKRGWSK